MWFLRRRHNKSGEEAQKALEEAQQNLAKVQKRSGEVTRIASALKDLRERNHFAERLEEIFIHGGGR